MLSRWKSAFLSKHAAKDADTHSNHEKSSVYAELLHQDVDGEPIDFEHGELKHPQRKGKTSSIISKAIVIVLSASVGFGVAILTIHPGRQTECQPCYVTDEQCSQHMSASSPLLHDGVVTYDWGMYDGVFDAPSIYRGQPTREKDEEWMKLENRQIVGIEPMYLGHLNKSQSTDSFLKAPPEFGDLYAGYLEVHHQLHCLNSLRQFTYEDFYLTNMDELPAVFRGSPTIVRMHLDHCIEMLRINLMCTADVTPILFRLDPSMPKGMTPDFSTKHKCRRLDAIVRWEHEHSIPM